MKLYLPFDGNVKLSSPYGYRTLNGVKEFHKGLDLVGLDDSKIIAPCDGVVGSSTIITDKSNLTWQWGNYVRLDTSDGLYIFMCHMASRNVIVGQKVRKGDVLGVMGSTGYSFAPHTHFEVRDASGQSLNPCQFLGIENTGGSVFRNPKEEKQSTAVPKDEKKEQIERGKEIYEDLMAYLSSLGESDWSKKEGYFAKAKKKGIMDGASPRCFVTREQLAAVEGREGIL